MYLRRFADFADFAAAKCSFQANFFLTFLILTGGPGQAQGPHLHRVPNREYSLLLSPSQRNTGMAVQLSTWDFTVVFTVKVTLAGQSHLRNP
jgi:hypothetical protein